MASFTSTAAPSEPLLAATSNTASVIDSVRLVVGLSDADSYGNYYNGVRNQQGSATFLFDGIAEAMTLTVTGYDIDVANEVTVLVNGRELGNLQTTSNNGTATTALPVNADDQNGGTNRLEFRVKNSNWRWGITDIMLTLGCNAPLVQN